jgi:thermostable 8-oxoguanine DNA glycosylase
MNVIANEITKTMESDSEFQKFALNANNYPLFKSLNLCINYPQTALWTNEILLATIVTGASWPAALYISASALSKNTFFNRLL